MVYETEIYHPASNPDSAVEMPLGVIDRATGIIERTNTHRLMPSNIPSERAAYFALGLGWLGVISPEGVLDHVTLDLAEEQARKDNQKRLADELLEARLKLPEPLTSK